MKIVVLDGAQGAQDDISFECLQEFGEVVFYENTDQNQLLERIVDADVLVTNRVVIDKNAIDNAGNLKLVATFSTGFNQVDIEHAKNKGIVVSNCPGYSSFAVAQGTMALLLEACNKTSKYDRFVRDGHWTSNAVKTLWEIKPMELYGKTLGIIGFGNIGASVANMAQAFGMKILAFKRTPDYSLESENLKFVSLDEIYKNADVISLHCALNDQTREMINNDTISKMKDGVIIVNTARGQLVAENDLCKAILADKIGAYATDVPYNEPLLPTDLIATTKNTVIMPHVTWIARDTRLRLLGMVCSNIKNFLDGKPSNVVNK